MTELRLTPGCKRKKETGQVSHSRFFSSEAENVLNCPDLDEKHHFFFTNKFRNKCESRTWLFCVFLCKHARFVFSCANVCKIYQRIIWALLNKTIINYFFLHCFVPSDDQQMDTELQEWEHCSLASSTVDSCPPAYCKRA